MRIIYMSLYIRVKKLSNNTNHGNVYINKDGYLQFTNGKHRGKLYHRVIYEKFVGNIPEDCVVHHIDGNKLNNDILNLEVMSFEEHSRMHKNEFWDKEAKVE